MLPSPKAFTLSGHHSEGPSRHFHHFLACLAAITIVLLNCSGGSWSQTLLGTTIVNTIQSGIHHRCHESCQERDVGTLSWNRTVRMWVTRCHLRIYLAQLSGPPFNSPISDPISVTGYLRQWFGREYFGINHFTVITHTKNLYVCVLQRSIDIMSGDGDSNHSFCH